MNILHINKFHYLRGGSEMVYFRTANILESHGHQSIFFSMNHPENQPCNNSDYFMPYVDLNNMGSIVNQVKNAGRIIYSFEAKKLLSSLLDKHKVDVAHLHNIHHQISPSILHELKKRKIPIVMTLHDLKMSCASYAMQVNGKICEKCIGEKYLNAAKNKCVKNSFSKSLFAVLEMYLHHRILDIYNNVDVFISPSLFVKDKLREMGFKKNIMHLPNCIDISKIENINYENDVEENSIVYFGRLSPEKGLWILLEAAQILLQKNIEFEIKIIGDGSIRDKLEQKVKLDKIKNVKFLGYMKGDLLYKEIKKSKIVILPSECYENNPISVLEAFALSKPVIGSKIGGIPELVIDNKTGYTFLSGNAEDLSSKIEYLKKNPDKCIEMGKKGKMFVKEEFNIEKYYEKLIVIYKQAIGKNK